MRRRQRCVMYVECTCTCLTVLPRGAEGTETDARVRAGSSTRASVVTLRDVTHTCALHSSTHTSHNVVLNSAAYQSNYIKAISKQHQGNIKATSRKYQSNIKTISKQYQSNIKALMPHPHPCQRGRHRRMRPSSCRSPAH